MSDKPNSDIREEVVERFTPDVIGSKGAWPTMTPHKTGGYVRYSDYAALAAERDTLQTQLEELHTMKTAGIIEVAVHNQRVSEYMKHWEARAEVAEQALATARADALRDERLLDINTTAMSEVKALADGETTNTLAEIVDWAIKEISLIDHPASDPKITGKNVKADW